MKVLSIGLALAVVAIVVAAVVLLPGSPQEPSSAQKPTPAPVSTPTAAPGKPAPATPTPILVPIRHPPTPTPSPTATPAPIARLTVDELINQLKANPNRYKKGDTLIVIGFLEEEWYSNFQVTWELEAPDGWEVYFKFPESVSPSAKPGDMVEVQITINSPVYKGHVSAKNASVIKVTKQKQKQ